jgi:hypothetical protein
MILRALPTSGANHTLGTRFRGRLPTILGHSASHSERLFLPLKRPCRRDRGTAQVGGLPTFANLIANDKDAPISGRW